MPILGRLIAPASILILTGASIGLAVLLAIKVPSWFTALASIKEVKDRLTLENEILKNLMQVVGGAFLVVGVYFTWRNTYLAKEGQLTERFNKAIDHLGDEKLEIRLGGIYALARIANDSPKDHWPVMQILCAYVRSHAVIRAQAEASLPTDLQTVLTVLGERTIEYETEEQCLELTKVDLRLADLKGARLDRARFDDSDLSGADLMCASLRSADFRGANLRKAHLREARLEGANFISADLEEASLRLANLRGANLLGARFQKTTLVGADLTGAVYVVRGQLEEAIVDESTRLPELLEVEKSG